MAVADVVDLLACPHCRHALRVVAADRVVTCQSGHSFDLARQGYLNLLGTAAPQNADTAAMVAARHRFLSSGAYAPLADRLVEVVHRAATGGAALLEVGAGTGYYLSRLLEGWTGSRGVALDVSVAAARVAARAHPRLGSVVADAWQTLPVAEGAVDVVLNVFAPRNADEFRRVLTPSGLLVTVTPSPGHLAEVRGPLGLLDIQPAKEQQLAASLAATFRQRSQQRLEFPCELDRAQLRDLVAMGPSAFHLSETALDDRVRALAETVTVSVALTIGVWAPRRGVRHQVS